MRLLAMDNDDLVLSAMKIAVQEIQDQDLVISKFLTCPKRDDVLPTLEREAVDVCFLDLDMDDGVPLGGLEVLKEIKSKYPDMICIILTGHDETEIIQRCMEQGASDYLVKPFTNGRLKITLVKAKSLHKIVREKRALKAQCNVNATDVRSLSSKSPKFQRCLDLARKVIGKRIPLLITGETGTGKEVFARYIWAQERDSTRPLISVHCGAISENLVESTLFGHTKGAFTGADKNKKGVFEDADGGDIFLDEIATMPAEVQVKLLRTLNTGEVVRVGETRGRQFDFRLISATNESLEELVGQKSFREDLFYRLKGIEIKLPPLRERMEDLEDLIRGFLINQGYPNLRLSEEALEFCRHYSWPGNIRQLERTISVLAQLSDGTEISLDEIQTQLTAEATEGRTAQSSAVGNSLFSLSGDKVAGSYNVLLEECEKAMVSHAFSQTKNFSEAAKYLGITRQSLSRRTSSWGWQKN